MGNTQNHPVKKDEFVAILGPRDLNKFLTFFFFFGFTLLFVVEGFKKTKLMIMIINEEDTQQQKKHALKIPTRSRISEAISTSTSFHVSRRKPKKKKKTTITILTHSAIPFQLFSIFNHVIFKQKNTQNIPENSSIAQLLNTLKKKRKNPHSLP